MGVFNLLVSHLCRQWEGLLGNGCHDDQSIVVQSVRNRERVLVKAVTFGPVFKKNLRYTCI